MPRLRALTRPALFTLVLAAAALRADNFKVDIDAAFPARGDTTAAGFSQWALSGDLNSTKRSATHTFTGTPAGNITCLVRQTAPAATDATIFLQANWQNKNGIAGGYLLAFDGVWVHQKNDATSTDRPYASGGAFDLVVTGLSAGTHTFTTYHNNVWGSSYGAMSKCVITVNGTTVATVAPSNQVTNDNDCAAAFFTVTAVAGQPLVISFTPDHSGALDNVILNGFEIDRAAPPGATATTPVPANGDEHVFANNDAPTAGSEGRGSTTLGFTPAASAVSHDVYFGTDRAAVAAATRTSPLFRGNQVGTSYAAANLSSALTYYWRVDEITAAGNTITGAVWSFRTRHLAFPGAEGYGRFARGGRGGRVIEVTNLLDYASNEAVIPGSYRAAIEATGPRTIVFRVSGLIRLKRSCTISAENSYVTIAGQTAPGEGICLANYSAGIGGANDVIMRFMRERLGEAAQTAMDGIGMGVGTDHSIIDHCTISWTIDEGTSSRDGRNITFQRNLVSEALQHSYHYAAADRTKLETHAFAGSISGQIGSYHHNLLAHCTDRNWSLAGGLTQDSKYAGTLDIRNNVVYNWTARTTDGGVFLCNYVNNYYKPYTPNPYVTWLLKLDAINEAWGIPKYYFTGNVMEGKSYLADNWGTAFQNGPTVAAQVRSDTPLFESYVTTHTAAEAYKLVLSDVGANQPQADVIDRRIVNEVRTGTTTYTGTRATNYPNGIRQPPERNYPGIIDQPEDVKDAAGSPNYPWPAYATYNVPTDTDHDGLPDFWENALGSDPRTASNNEDPDGDGYTRLDDYLAYLAAPHALTTTGQTTDLDLRPLAAGFTNPTFRITGATLGSATLQADGRIVRFVPTAGARGLGSVTFTATDPDGVTFTSTYQVAVSPTAPAFETGGDTRLINLSVRATSRSRATPLIIGFVVAGGTKPLLIRAIGPGLTPFGVPAVLPDPFLEVHTTVAGQDTVATSNDNWGAVAAEATALRTSFAATGAFGLADAASKDSAVLASLAGGNSGLVYDSANRSGTTLIELYDAAPTATPRLSNASVRNTITPGGDALIAGFVLSGNAPRRVLVRAIGPTLGAFGVPGTAPDPQLELFDGAGQPIAANDNWADGDASPLRRAFAATGAFDLPDTSAKDAVLLATLPPGGYTARVTPKGTVGGEVLLELYEVP